MWRQKEWKASGFLYGLFLKENLNISLLQFSRGWFSYFLFLRLQIQIQGFGEKSSTPSMEQEQICK